MELTTHIQNILENMLTHLGIEKFNITMQQEHDDTYVFHIDAEEAPLLIGRHGTGLASMQQLLILLLRNTREEEVLPRIRIDIGNYKEKYEKSLLEMIDKKIEMMMENDIRETLHPMNSYHRRLIHLYILEKYPHIETESIGTGTLKKVILRKKEQNSSMS